MIDEAAVEDRLRRTYADVAARTTLRSRAAAVSLTDVSNDAMPRRHRSRRNRLALIALLALMLAAGGTAWVTGGTSRRVEVGNTSPSSERPTLSPVPAAITGAEQTISRALVPADIPIFFSAGVAKWQTSTGRPPAAYQVGTGTSFVISDTFITADATPTNASHDPSGDQGSCSFYDGTLPIGGQGYGIEVACVPLADIEAGTKHAVFLFPDFPKPAQDTTVWTHFPAATAFVNFSGAGITPLWERPVGGVAAFTVGVSTNYTGDNFQSAPHPLLRAYDAAGHLLAALTSPYLVNFMTSATGS